VADVLKLAHGERAGRRPGGAARRAGDRRGVRRQLV